MSQESLTPKEHYKILIEELLANPDVSQSKKSGFGSGLRVNGKVFAMFVKDRLVIKLPQPRVMELVASGEGAPYEYSNGRVTKEWVAIQLTSREHWHHLAEEAMTFADSKR